MKILIAEDDLGSRRLLSLRLLNAGYEVEEAQDGQEAWDAFQGGNFQMVITDWMMPNLDGMALIQNIRSSGRKNYTYIIVLTMLDDKSNLLFGLSSGADEYLIKPFDPRELLARVAIGERIINLEAQLNEAHRKMEIFAMQDELTGLFNRRSISQSGSAELDLAKRKSRPLSLILLDVDFFKIINDSYGHTTGDVVLRHLAKILNQNQRNYDHIGRWGGEEFIVILPDTTTSEAIKVAERLRLSIAESKIMLDSGETFSITASLGVSSSTDSTITFDHLVASADTALYQAKHSGRNRVCTFIPESTAE